MKKKPESLSVMTITPAILAMILPLQVLAHAGEKGFIMLLPTRLFIVSGTLVVCISFLLMLRMPLFRVYKYLTREKVLLAWPSGSFELSISMISLLIFLLLVLAGFIGSTDPLTNPIGSVIWSWFWIGLVFLHVLVGNLWSILSPWRALSFFVVQLQSVFGHRRPSFYTYPVGLAYWPAVILLVSILWFENVSLSPYDPKILAKVMLAYLVFTALCIGLFGKSTWLRYGEVFSVYLRMTSLLAPLQFRMHKKDDVKRSWQLVLTWPWMNLLKTRIVPASAVVFILTALAGVTFDGAAQTFKWLSLIDINPLEFGGRSTVVWPNTIGLVCTCLLLIFLYYIAAESAARLSGCSKNPVIVNRLVLSLIPIAFAYHFAHYLPAFSLESQYALRAVSDPFDLGWNLFGTGNRTIIASVRTDYHFVTRIWYIQIFVIVISHTIAILIAHLIAYDENKHEKPRLSGQLPLTFLMICYTFLGLWLLSAPGI